MSSKKPILIRCNPYVSGKAYSKTVAYANEHGMPLYRPLGWEENYQPLIVSNTPENVPHSVADG